ncbi:MAG: aminomethyl transferase family protein [Nitrospirae bacterium]|nr:aminomethyl transferase family protein [Nitrospirota bacterium]
MTPSPLADVHRALGARFLELDGHEVVADYGDPLAEQRRVRATGGLIDRSYRGTLRVSGPDRVALLQGMTTNDVLKQADDSAIPNAICTGHGKVQSLFTTIRRADHFLLDMDPALTGFTTKFLEKYTIIRDAKTEDVSDRFAHFGLYGPHARAVAAAGLSLAEDRLPDAGRVAEAGTALVIGTAELGMPGFEILPPRAAARETWDALLAAGVARDVLPFGFTALEGLRIEMGRARYGVEVDDTVILLEAGFRDTASFGKGCYIGQETLSRIVFRGHVNRALKALLLDGDAPAPVSGTEVTADGKGVGQVKSAAFSPSLGKVVALAYVKASHWDAGTAVDVGGVPARVAEPPLIPAA